MVGMRRRFEVIDCEKAIVKVNKGGRMRKSFFAHFFVWRSRTGGLWLASVRVKGIDVESHHFLIQSNVTIEIVKVIIRFIRKHPILGF